MSELFAMVSISSLLLTLLAAPAAAALASGAPTFASSQLVVSPCDAGDHYQFETVECAIELRNLGDKAITVSKGEARFAWDSIDAGAVVVPPKGTNYIKTRVDLRNDEGVTRRAFRFATDEPGQAYRGSEVKVYVQSVLDQVKPKLDFGSVALGTDELPSASVGLNSREVPKFKIVAIESAPDWLKVSVGDDGRTIAAQLLDSAPWGTTHLGNAFVKLKINTPQQSHAWIEVNARVIGDVAADGDPYQLGVMRTAGKHEFLVRLTSRSKKDFELGRLDVERIKATAKPEPCVPATTGCRLVRLTLSNDQAPGKLDGVLSVGLPGYDRTLPVELVGMLLTPETKIHQLDDLVKASSESEGAMSAAPAAPTSIGRAIESTIRKHEPPLPGIGPLLRWSVAHQSPIYGYAIYRADSEKGSFLRISKEIIPVMEEDGKDKSGNYQWRDNTAESGKTYWYQIGIINRNGSKANLTGPQKVVAK